MRQHYERVRGLWIVFDGDEVWYSDTPERGERDSPILAFSVFIGRRCPFRCRYCYNQHKMLTDPLEDEEPGYRRALLWPHELLIILGGEPALYRERVAELLARTRDGYGVSVDTAIPRPWCPFCVLSLFDDDTWMKQVRVPPPPPNMISDVRPTLSSKKTLKPREIKTEYYGDIEPHAPSRWSVGYTFYASKTLTTTKYENCFSPKLNPRGEISFCESVYQVYQSAYEPPLPVPYAWIAQERVPSSSGRCGITQLLVMNRIYIENPGSLKVERSGAGEVLENTAERSAEDSGKDTGEPQCLEGLCFSC